MSPVLLLVLAALSLSLILVASFRYSSRPTYVEFRGGQYALLAEDFGRWATDERLRRRFPKVIFAEGVAVADPLICEFDVGVFEDVGVTRGFRDMLWEVIVERKFCQERIPRAPWPSDVFQVQECMYVVDRLGCRRKEIEKGEEHRVGDPGIIVYCLMSRALKCLGLKEKGPWWVLEHCLQCKDAGVFDVSYNRREVEMKLDHLLEYWLGKREPTMNPSPAKCIKCRVSNMCLMRSEVSNAEGKLP
jgi:hypothetical protein